MNRHLGLTAGIVGLILFPLAMHHAWTAPEDGPDDEVLSTDLQSDGKVILGGPFSPGRVARLLEDGTIDHTFYQSWATGSSGGFNAPVYQVAVEPNDSIVVGGSFTNFDTALVGHIARLHADGSLDTDFANRIGTGFDDDVLAVQIQSDGKILVGGKFTSFNGESVPRVARLRADGTLDTGWRVQEGDSLRAVYALGLSDDQKIVLGGEPEATSLTPESAASARQAQSATPSPMHRYLDTGQRDPNFEFVQSL